MNDYRNDYQFDITDDMLVDAPEIEEVLTEFKEWVGDAILM